MDPIPSDLASQPIPAETADAIVQLGSLAVEMIVRIAIACLF